MKIAPLAGSCDVEGGELAGLAALAIDPVVDGNAIDTQVLQQLAGDERGGRAGELGEVGNIGDRVDSADSAAGGVRQVDVLAGAGALPAPAGRRRSSDYAGEPLSALFGERRATRV